MMVQQLLPALFVFWTTLSPVGSVEEVQITPLGDETQITIVTEGAVEVEDFLLRDPARLVIDIKGAAHGLPRYAYNEIARGGVTSMRSSQFRDGVVRLVFDLSGPPEYDLSSDTGAVRVRFRNPGGTFEAWSTGRGARATTAASTTSGSSAPDRGSTSTTDAAGASGAAALPATPEAPADQPAISVTYDQANMLDVLAGFSEFSGLSIVSGPAVGDRTVRGIEIRDKPWDVALDAILSSQGLDWRRLESGIIIVDEVSALRSRDTLQTETRVLRINYADAADVAGALQNLASSGRGQVVAYEGSNSVIVTDAPSVVSRMDSLVSVLDQRTPQVSIEAKIIFVDRTNVNSMGIVYDLKDLDGNQINDVTTGIDPTTGAPTEETVVDLGGESVAALANANDRLAAPALQILASAAFGNFSLSSFIEALESHQLSDIQAAPSIQVLDNHLARIQVGERTPIRILEPQAQQQATVNVQFEDTGIILEATPHITNNDQILIDLHAERSGLAEAQGDVGLVFDKQTGDTRLLLDDGETAVIAGLTLSEVTRFESGIPILMNLPVLGQLFRTTRETENKQDLIILVTPHIIRDSPQAALN